MNTVNVASVGLLAPGLDGWVDSQAALVGNHTYRARELKIPAPDILPANERRRATALTRAALRVAQEAVMAPSISIAELGALKLYMVFASSHGDASVTDRICRALSTAERLISPTDFHNSVHNAPAGYWSIGTHSRMASVSISLQDGTFAAGLLEAITLASVESVPTLLVACDLPLPYPLSQVEHVGGPFAVALILTSGEVDRSRLTSGEVDRSRVRLCAALRAGAAEDRMEVQALEALRLANPAARSLPLLRALANGGGRSEQTITLPYLDETRVEVQIKIGGVPQR